MKVGFQVAPANIEWLNSVWTEAICGPAEFGKLLWKLKLVLQKFIVICFQNK